MFGKCLKYELRSAARTILPLFIAVIVLSLLVGIGFCVDGRLIPESPEGEITTAETIFSLVQVLLVFALVIGITAMAITVFVVMIRRYYVSFFSDEGYLTFTLPVSTDCHLMTKVISMTIWNAASILVMFLAYAMIFGGLEIGYGGISEVFAELGVAFAELGAALSLMPAAAISAIIFYVLGCIVSIFAQILVIYFAVSLGCMMTKKHRVLVSLLCLFGINTVISIVSQIMMVVTVTSAQNNPEIALLVSAISFFLLVSIELASCYLGTRWILTKKLNLD